MLTVIWQHRVVINLQSVKKKCSICSAIKVCLFACICFGFSVAQLFLFSTNQLESFNCFLGTENYYRIILEVRAGFIREGGIELDNCFPRTCSRSLQGKVFLADKINEGHLVNVARECSVLGQFLKTTKTSPVSCRTSECPCVCVGETRGPQPLGSNAWWSGGGADVIVTESAQQR